MTVITEDVIVGGLHRVTLDNGMVRARFLPEIGGKMTSLVRISSGHEFLLQPQRPLRRPTYGDPFEAFDTSGFDECLPTVSACRDPTSGQLLPDHGELWSVYWQVRISSEQLCLSASGRVLPYRLTKTVRLESQDVVIDYELVNESDSEIKFLWSAHPLLAVEPGSKIVLPAEVKEVLVNYSLNDRLGKFGDRCYWPVAEARGVSRRLDILAPPTAGFADKVFTGGLTEGNCSFLKPASSESISFLFDSMTVPYIGLWICQGGWPDPSHGHYTAALEPCSGRPDSLCEAIARGENDLLRPGSTKNWSLRLRVQQIDQQRFC
ncbi:MAG: hypothetical protein DMG40_23270 [Acidobacteria bacterium]|nr:MAG: hypothetical protein DMG40_23270 [Acidobacteriota bacterium]